MAVPVLATPAAMEGLECNDLVGLQVSDNEQQFSEMAVQLLQQDSSQLLQASRQWVCQHHDWSTNSKKIYELFEALPGQPEKLTES